MSSEPPYPPCEHAEPHAEPTSPCQPLGDTGATNRVSVGTLPKPAHTARRQYPFLDRRNEFVSDAANDPTSHDAPQRNPSMQRNTLAEDQLGLGRQGPSGQHDAG